MQAGLWTQSARLARQPLTQARLSAIAVVSQIGSISVAPCGARVLWPSLSAARDRAHNDPGPEPDDDEIDDHLPGDYQARRFGLGGDVAEADCCEHGDDEVARWYGLWVG